MSRKEPTFGELLIKSAREGLAIKRGEAKAARETRYQVTARVAGVRPPPRYDAAAVKKIRSRMEVSQQVFAEALNVSRDTVRAWEQGKREPDGASRRLLQIAARSPGLFLGDVKLRENDRVHRTTRGPWARAARPAPAHGAHVTAAGLRSKPSESRK